MSRPVTRRMAAAQAPVQLSEAEAEAQARASEEAARVARASQAARAATATSRRVSAATKKAQMIDDLRELLQQPHESSSALNEYMLEKPEYLWDYKYWKDAIHLWIENGKWGPLFWYLMIFKNADGIEGLKPFITDVLDKMYDTNSNGLFRNSELWTEMRTYLKENRASWWIQHVEHAQTDDAYLVKLFQRDWPHVFSVAKSVLDIRPVSEDLCVAMAKHVYNNNPLVSSWKFFNRVTFSAHIDKEHYRPFILALINERPSSPPLVAAPNTYDNLRVFVAKCIKGGYTDILNAFLEQMNMKRAENLLWLQNLFTNLLDKSTAASAVTMRKDSEAVFELLVRYNKINLNNIYMDLTDDTSANISTLLNTLAVNRGQLAVPIMNPITWINKNLSMVALAVMHGNKKVLLLLISLGATVKRCAFGLQDLTSDPEILKILVSDSKATKIQRAFLRHMYAPEHGTQAVRQSAWDSKLGAEK